MAQIYSSKAKQFVTKGETIDDSGKKILKARWAGAIDVLGGKVLETVFNKSQAESNRIMLNVHKKGIGICGIYTHEIAETKVTAATVEDAE